MAFRNVLFYSVAGAGVATEGHIDVIIGPVAEAGQDIDALHVCLLCSIALYFLS